MTTKPPEFDVTSADPVLFYVGPGVTDAPADDLSANALARLVWIRTRQAPTQSQIAALRDELVATGHYRTTQETPDV